MSDKPPFTVYPFNVWNVFECPYDKECISCKEKSQDAPIMVDADDGTEKVYNYNTPCFFFREFKYNGFDRWYCVRVATEEMQHIKLARELDK
jgi:hypothetical protein